MKLNWTNIVATILIVAGIYLLVKRTAPKPHPATATTHPISDEEIRERFYAEISQSLGRPLNDIEKQMISVSVHGNQAQATLMEPLRSRVILAQQQRRAATQAQSSIPSDTPGAFASDGTSPAMGDVHALGAPASPLPATVPSTVP